MNKLTITNQIRPVGRKAMLFIGSELLFLWVLNGSKQLLGGTLAIVTAANLCLFILVYGTFWAFQQTCEIDCPRTRFSVQAVLLFASFLLLFTGSTLVKGLLQSH